MNKFLWYIKSILWNSDSSNASHVTTTESTQKHLHTNISWVQDQFTFLYNNFDNYKEDKNPPRDFRHVTKLLEKYFVNDPNPWSSCIYRWMWLIIDDIRKIYNSEWMLKEKVNYNSYHDDEEENEKIICFTDRYHAYKAIGWAAQEGEELSFIFEVPERLIKEHNIPLNWSGDVMRIERDIPPEIIQQSNIFVVDYKNQTLVKIPPIQ